MTSLGLEKLGSARLTKTYNPSSGNVDLLSEGGDLGPARWITVVGSATAP